jgi:predicted nucleic acid-binding protein
MTVLIDTNVLLRIADVNHTTHSICRQSLEQLNAAKVEISIVPQVLYEFWVVATRPIEVNGLGMSHSSVTQSLQLLIARYTFYRNDAALFDRWHALVTTQAIAGKTAHDARLVAAMLSHNIGCILTLTTQDFARYSQIETLAPNEVLAGKLPR